MSGTKAIAIILCVALFTGAVTFLARQKTIDGLKLQNRLLQGKLKQVEADRKSVQAKYTARELELEEVRKNGLELARLREIVKSNGPPPKPPTGFYVGTDNPIFVPYGSSDPIVRAFIKSLMDENPDPVEKGRIVFEKICAACHQPDGMGREGIAPPLVGSEWILAKSGERLARIVLNGLSGPITVKGKEWNLPMPPWRDNLDDEAIAVVLSYIRGNVGTNKAPAIQPETIAAARKEVHPGPESVAELEQIPMN